MRGPFVPAQPVVVLVNRWIGRMSEVPATGSNSNGAGTVVGAEIAGLEGATIQITLPSTGITIDLPAERLHQVNGTPREGFRLRGRYPGRAPR